jgi:GNAT superfamily N-acetyltransferase
MMSTTTPGLRTLPTRDSDGFGAAGDSDLAGLARQPWTLRVGRQALLVRPAAARDLAAVARLHSRCSARSLLDRYRSGGRAPAVAALDAMLRRPHNVVAVTAAGEVVAIGTLERDNLHNSHCAETGLLVEDGWQRLGIGSELISHLAGIAQAAGYRELIAYPATAVPAAQRLMIEVGRTRMVPDVHAHLHTYLPETAALGIGAVRQRLAG